MPEFQKSWIPCWTTFSANFNSLRRRRGYITIYIIIVMCIYIYERERGGERIPGVLKIFEHYPAQNYSRLDVDLLRAVVYWLQQV